MLYIKTLGPHRAWDSWVYKRVLIKKLLRRMDPQEAATRMCDGGVFRVFFFSPAAVGIKSSQRLISDARL